MNAMELYIITPVIDEFISYIIKDHKVLGIEMFSK